jgi:HSP20 family protein
MITIPATLALEHVEEPSYGSFYRLMSLPFEPQDGAAEAHFDKGVLRLTIKKASEGHKAKTIEIKTGTGALRKAA